MNDDQVDLTISGSVPIGSRGRIVHVIDGLGYGGAERLLAPILKGLRQSGYDARVVALQIKNGNPEADRLIESGIPCDYIQLDKLKRVDQTLKVLRRLHTMKPDLIHAHLQFSVITSGLMHKVFGTPTVATIHTDESIGGFDNHGLRMRLTNTFLSTSFNTVISLTNASKTNAFENGLAKAPLTVIPNGIDLTRFESGITEKRQQMREELGIEKNDVVLMTVAVLRPEKGVDRLIHVMEQLRHSHPQAKVIIVGDGPEMMNLKDQSIKAGLRDRVIFLGYRSDIADLLSSADIFVLPTLADALPTVVIEAMASSLPIVASRVGGIPEMVFSGLEGTLVSPDNVAELTQAIIELIDDPDKRETFGKNAQVRAKEEFSLNKQIEKLSLLYEGILRPKREKYEN